MTDPIADLLTRLRNGLKANHRAVRVPHSRMKEGLAQILLREGYLSECHVEDEDGKRRLVLAFRYDPYGRPVISGLQRISRPGCRIYARKSDVPVVLGGLGVTIVSTSHGLMTGEDSRRAGLGGEVLCSIW